MKITTIQLYEDTKKKLNQMKEHDSESYDSVLKRIIEDKEIPSMQEMFERGDKIKQKRIYSTEEVVKMSHELRDKR
ncbi:hypothetical protein HYS31_01470 [Candidatus Woesearchaeota archaeon]|nr:hypothetical protein [Candidatus Woesearchaeota archaeon]